MYSRISNLGIEDEDNQKALHAKVSPLVRKVLDDLKQYLLTKSAEIKQVYKAGPFLYSELVTDVLQSLYTTQEAIVHSAVGDFSSALSSIAKSLKSRSVGHFLDVIALCCSYPQSDFFLPLEDWIDSAVLENIKLINSFLKNSGKTKSHQGTIDFMYKTLETIKPLCTLDLSETRVKYKRRRRSAVVAAANSSKPSLFGAKKQETSFQERIALTGGLAPLVARLSDPDTQVQKNAALELMDLVKTGDDLKNVLAPISSEERDTVVRVMKDQLLALTSTAEDLGSVISVLSEKESTRLKSLRGEGSSFKSNTNVPKLFSEPASSTKKKVSLYRVDRVDEAPAQKQAK